VKLRETGWEERGGGTRAGAGGTSRSCEEERRQQEANDKDTKKQDWLREQQGRWALRFKEV